METLAYMVEAIIATLSLVLLGWLFVHSLLKWLEPRRRAGELLRAVLTRAQYRQLMWHCYVDIPSPRDPQCTYRVPRYPGLVGLIEQGRRSEQGSQEGPEEAVESTVTSGGAKHRSTHT